MDVKSLQEVVFLLKLYTIEKGTLKEFSDLGGFCFGSGKIHRLSKSLIQDGIISHEGFKIQEKGVVAVYRVHHKVLDEFFVCKFPTRFIYKRTARGPISTMPLMKPDYETLKRWGINEGELR
jgi:hypothetical protein